MKRMLNIRQERFAELVASGMSAMQAYSEAGYSKDPRIAHAHATRLVANGGVKTRIAELRTQQTKKALMTRDRKRELLCLIAEDTSRPSDARIRAIAEDNKMAGHYEPDRTEIEVGQGTLFSIKERAMQLSRAMGRRYMLPDEEPSRKQKAASVSQTR